MQNMTHAVEISSALEELAYHGPMLARWAQSSKVAQTYGGDCYGKAYLKLVVEELDKIEKQAARLRAALSAASVQLDTRETQGVAA